MIDPTQLNPTSAPDPLAGLRDWHLPDPVSWWPPAPGWWLVAGLVLVVGGLILRWWFKRRLRTAPARAALSELERLRADLERDRDDRRFVAALSALLRRVALTRYPRDQVAGLSGEAWLAFLDRSGGDGRFSQGAGRALVGMAYREPNRKVGPMGDPVGASSEGSVESGALDTTGLATLARDWIRAHREGNA